MASQKAVKRITVEEIKKATMTRGTLYRVLSRGFSLEVDEAFLEWMILLQPTINQLAVNVSSRDFSRGSKRLGSFVADAKTNYEKDKTQFVRDLAAEYESLFLNVGSNPVYLVESLYFGKEKQHQLYEEPYYDAMRTYQRYGFKKRSSFREPEDHLAIELEFMAHLCDLACLSLEQEKNNEGKGYLNIQVDFLNSHLSKWVPQLVSNLREASKNEFYLAFADLLSGFTRTDSSTASEFARELAN